MALILGGGLLAVSYAFDAVALSPMTVEAMNLAIALPISGIAAIIHDDWQQDKQTWKTAAALAILISSFIAMAFALSLRGYEVSVNTVALLGVGGFLAFLTLAISKK